MSAEELRARINAATGLAKAEDLKPMRTEYAVMFAGGQLVPVRDEDEARSLKSATVYVREVTEWRAES